MASAPLHCAASASKLRRQRATAVRQKLFESSQRCDPLLLWQTQLAMLAASVDNLQYLLLRSTFATLDYVRHEAAELVQASRPNTAEDLAVPVHSVSTSSHAYSRELSASIEVAEVQEPLVEPASHENQLFPETSMSGIGAGPYAMKRYSFKRIAIVPSTDVHPDCDHGDRPVESLSCTTGENRFIHSDPSGHQQRILYTFNKKA
jgi:hypothetical protein